MDSDSWSRLSSGSSRRSLRPRFDLYLGFEEMEGAEEELKSEIICPFCSEDFETMELCFHIEEEHPIEAKNRICPICTVRVGMDLVSHIIMQHGNLYKMKRRKKTRTSNSNSNNRANPFGSYSTLNLLRKDLREGNLHSLFGGPSSSYSNNPPSAVPDPLLSSFVRTLSVSADASKSVREEEESEPFDERELDGISLEEEPVSESVQPKIPKEDLEERARKSEFVRGIVFSTLFDEETL